ncbi:MAG: SCO family protein [Terriglobales bacterium]
MKREISVAMKVFLVALLLAGNLSWAAQQYTVTGLVLKVDPSHGIFTVSCNRIPGYMEAMVMTFPVRKPETLNGIRPSAIVEFVLYVDTESSYADDIRVRSFESVEQEPQEAERLKLLQDIANPGAPVAPLAIGDAVPDVEFTDQNQQRVEFSQFAGEVVVLTFIYTRCPNPNYCFRLNSNLGRLQKRFPQHLGRDLVLLSLVIDPEHDQGKTLTNYANIWRANPQGWHFLTGPLPDIQKTTRLFGMDFWNGEGVVTHSFHTIVVDRQGKLAANIVGNQFTAQQLGDLVETMLSRQN